MGNRLLEPIWRSLPRAAKFSMITLAEQEGFEPPVAFTTAAFKDIANISARTTTKAVSPRKRSSRNRCEARLAEMVPRLSPPPAHAPSMAAARPETLGQTRLYGVAASLKLKPSPSTS
jgi:hypothetical protein